MRSSLRVRGHWWILVPSVLALSGCGLGPLRAPTEVRPANVNADATLTPATRITRELVKLPPPRFKVPVAVYGFRDQTGQYKPQPDSNLSNAVTQGAASILVKALLDSGWFMPIEREGLQNLLTERRVARAIETPADKGKAGSSYPPLMPANFVFEGGIVGYESNVRTGGEGANLLGIGGETKYRVDQVTVNLRSVDVRSGQIVNSVSVTKTIFSHEVSASVYKFIAYKTLLQAEGGYSSNEPSQLAVKEAIESAVIHLTVQGIRDRAWALKDDSDWASPLVQGYLREADNNVADPNLSPGPDGTLMPMRGQAMVLPPAPPTAIAAPGTTPAPAPSTAVAPVVAPVVRHAVAEVPPSETPAPPTPTMPPPVAAPAPSGGTPLPPRPAREPRLVDPPIAQAAPRDGTVPEPSEDEGAVVVQASQ